jgi:hypothetical protein
MAAGGHVLSDEDAWDVLEEIPNDSAAALILLEHHWAVPLRDASVRAGGFRISDGFISPLDLVEIGSTRPRRPTNCTQSSRQGMPDRAPNRGGIRCLDRAELRAARPAA